MRRVAEALWGIYFITTLILLTLIGQCNQTNKIADSIKNIDITCQCE